MYVFEVLTFFLPSGYPLNFSVVVHMYKIRVFDEAFFL